MKEDFFEWITNKKSFLSKYGIDTEKLIFNEESKNDYSSVIVHHYNPNKCLGQIEMFGVNMVYFEVIEFNSGERLAIEHTELDNEYDYNIIFESYFKALISGEKVG
ncbi:hypothetical protein [Cytobacillus sp. IB215665]|uniref:hypothetical protein n=1 Tax=Cytobacillus sp. IB215665 TaxID=3097357 RepID=UPI002A0D7FC2|nr:hypothetical protein [Cytobacillus sp. IB215665]MDX8367151.1 hypothetical protein [Cytobacillus sp. IB215665]